MYHGHQLILAVEKQPVGPDQDELQVGVQCIWGGIRLQFKIHWDGWVSQRISIKDDPYWVEGVNLHGGEISPADTL